MQAYSALQTPMAIYPKEGMVELPTSQTPSRFPPSRKDLGTAAAHEPWSKLSPQSEKQLLIDAALWEAFFQAPLQGSIVHDRRLTMTDSVFTSVMTQIHTSLASCGTQSYKRYSPPGSVQRRVSKEGRPQDRLNPGKMNVKDVMEEVDRHSRLLDWQAELLGN